MYPSRWGRATAWRTGRIDGDARSKDRVSTIASSPIVRTASPASR
ncbi:Uncharacterised protein [Mycobacteroides abscessus]|nr:Uncharacterised protein [Mycobacteroides abscessus]